MARKTTPVEPFETACALIQTLGRENAGLREAIDDYRQTLADVKTMLNSGYDPKSSRKVLADTIGKALDLIEMDIVDLDEAVTEMFQPIV